MFRETLPQIYFNAFLVFIIESSNMTVHIISIFFLSFSYLIVLITFWGVFFRYPAHNSFIFRFIGYPSYFLRWIINGLFSGVFQNQKSCFHFSTFWHAHSLTLTCCFITFSYMFVFWFEFSSFFTQECVIEKPPLGAVFWHYLQIYCLLIFQKNAVHDNDT